MHLIPSVLPSHSGTYSCVAENVLGQVRHHPLTTYVHSVVADYADDADDIDDDADDVDDGDDDDADACLALAFPHRRYQLES